MRTRITFDVVKVTGTRSVTDSATGRRRRERRTFEQTVNPFNIDRATGLPKDREQIYRELRRQRDRWEEGLPDAPPEIP